MQSLRSMTASVSKIPEITIYHGVWCRSVRLRWFLEEVGVPYKLKTVEYKKSAMQSPEYLKIHPLGQLPAITYGDIAMFDSGAILEFFYDALPAETTQKLPIPTELPQLARYFQFFHLGESLMTPFGAAIRHQRPEPGEDDAQEVCIQQNAVEANTRLAQRLAFLDKELEAHHPYILGEQFSAADIMLGYTMGCMAALVPEYWGNLVTKDYPHVKHYLENIQQRPAYQKTACDEHNNQT